MDNIVFEGTNFEEFAELLKLPYDRKFTMTIPLPNSDQQFAYYSVFIIQPAADANH